MRNYMLPGISCKHVSSNPALQQEKYTLIFSFSSSHFALSIDSRTLSLGMSLEWIFTFALGTPETFHSVAPRSLSFTWKGLPRNYKDRWHVLSANQSRTGNRVRRQPSLRKAFRAALAAVTFWVAIVKKKKESWANEKLRREEGRETSEGS